MEDRLNETYIHTVRITTVFPEYLNVNNVLNTFFLCTSHPCHIGNCQSFKYFITYYIEFVRRFNSKNVQFLCKCKYKGNTGVKK